MIPDPLRRCRVIREPGTTAREGLVRGYSRAAGVVWPLTRYHLCSVKIVLVCFFDRDGAKVSQCRYYFTERSPREESTVVRQARVQQLLVHNV